ncbi:unnamed protein product [Rotaria socialis]|uniref:Rapamycin-insensitive companion of mTOR n=1 Tax=Rotaria socialis TaxID=392032 RepID=A0A817RDJ4_9BILA|nr:unnamed protein product [Rotaria socialis]CAF3347362.1 unnamed protein product [Rotaria socialis]CAF3448632.1 unnamed protein product [Rotaria socialis]
MATGFMSLCDQILSASSPYTPYDVSKKPLSTLLNDMTHYVATVVQVDNGDDSIIYGLQILLLSDVERVRAASLRALRYSIHRTTIFDKFLQYRLDYLVCRSLTIDLRNARERLEAYKFIRRLFLLYPQRLPHSFVYVLDAIVASSHFISIPRTGNSTPIVRSDQMVKCCLELLCEIALQNPHILHDCHAINTMLKYIVDLEQDELRESVLYALLHAVDRFTINDNSEPTMIDSVDPNGPALVLVDEGMRERHELIGNMFSQLVAIFSLCEKGTLKTGDRRGMTPAPLDSLVIKEPDKLKTLKSCASAMATILHSWIGFTAFCQTRNSSIRLLVNCLLVQSEPMKMIILDLFYDLLNLDIPPVCDSYEAALKSIYPIWNLTTVEEGYTFVAYEGAAKLPRLSSTRPNLLDSHMALMLLTLIDAGFIEAISELASNDNSILSIRATLLLANFIWLCNENLPEEQSFLLLPLLMDVAIADDDSIKRSFAKEAMLNINAFFEFKQRTRHIYSFQLAQLIYHSQHLHDYYTLPPNIGTESNRRTSTPSSNDPLVAEKIDASIRDTNTLQSDNYKRWNWDLILALLKDFPKQANQVQGDLYERFLDKLCDFFKPEQSGGFNDILLTDSISDVTCRALLAFSDLLIYPSRPSSNHIKVIASNIARILLTSISDSLQQSIVSMRECSGRAVITEHDLLSKNSVYYYLFLGRLSKSSVGTQALMESDIFVRLSEMLKMDDEFATSAIVALSSFNYYYESPCRTYLTQALKSHCTALRLYSTSLLRVVLRSNPVAFGSWGLSLLITQLHDTDQQILIETVSVLDEALEDRRLVNLFHKLWEAFSTIKNVSGFLTQIYHQVTARMSSIPFNQVQHDDKHLSMIRDELAYWDTTFNTEYVTLIETKLFSAYSGGSLLTDDYFERRKTTSVTNKAKIKRSTAHVSSHLYRQLCLHPEGFRLLRSESRLEKYVTELRQHRTNCISLNETRVIKEALWTLANTASTEYGYSWFVEKDLLPDFLRFAEECQNLSVRGTAFYALSLIAQTPDGAISLKDFGWETYRVRSHSIPPSVANTDTCQSTERRISKGIMASSPRKSISLQVTPPGISTINNLPDNKTSLNLNEPVTADALPTNRFNLHKDSTSSDVKSKRSFTMPSSILLNSNEKTDVLHVIIPEESAPATPTSNIAMVSFSDCLETDGHPLLVSVPIRRCSSISKELTNVATCRDSGIASGATGSFSDFECSRSPSYQTYPSHSQSQSAAEQSATDSLPLERFRPRSKSAHQSNALRQSKQLQKVPEVIQALRAPTAGLGAASEPSATDELYRSRLLRCNFLLKPDAAGYEYARRVQKISHATYSHLVNTNYNDFYADDMLLKEKKDELLLPFQRYRSKFYKKIYESHDVHDQQIDKFLTDDGKYSSDQRDLDDADEDGNTIYRGLAVPVDIRQVVEISDGYNLNYETWSDLARSRSRGNTNADQARTRSATGASISSGEFTSTSPAVGSQDQMMPTTIIVPTNPMPSTPSLNICMMCINNTTSLTSHENPHISMQADFDDVKSLASRLIAAIHTDEVEKKLLSWKESRPRIFDNVCLYSEICYILTLSSVRVSAQRFLHDLFSDCQFEKLRKRRRQVDVLREEEDDDSLDTSTSSQ